MKIVSEMSLVNFEFWGGAKLNADMLTIEEMEQFEYVLEDLYSEGVTDTFINDLFWFELEWVCDCIGLQYDVENDIIIR